MTTIRVAYQGERGAFSERAARRLAGDEIETIACMTFDAMFDSVLNDESDCCVAPIENSLAGSIHRNYDLMTESGLSIAGETNLRIVHNLIAPPDVELHHIRRVYSHPVALAQCTRFLGAHRAMEPTAVHDTAGAVRIIMEEHLDDAAASASDDAAAIYGARILVRGVEDNAQNFTRFLLLKSTDRHLPVPAPAARWKTSLVFRIANKPGALFRALGVFAMFDIDLSKIESRPIEGKPWEYAFYLDLIGRAEDAKIARAISNLSEMAEMVRVLGSYPSKW